MIWVEIGGVKGFVMSNEMLVRNVLRNIREVRAGNGTFNAVVETGISGKK